MTDTLKMLQRVVQLHAARDFDGAQGLCQQILVSEPNHPDAIHFMGVIAYEKGEFDLAKTCIQRAIDLNPSNQACYTNMGNVLQKEKNYSKALGYYQKTIRIDPVNLMAFNNIGAAYLKLGLLEKAKENFERALNINPEYAQAHNNLGDTLKKMGQYEEALVEVEKAINLSPDFVEARWNKSVLLLLMADFSKGWFEYEWRWKRQRTPQRRIDFGIRWDGSSFQGKTLFVYEEQGIGDTLQFLRYLPLVKQMGGHVIFEVIPPLMRLVQTVNGFDRLWTGIKGVDTRPTDRFDYSIPLLSIPGLLNTTLESIPGNTPYLSADKGLASIWKKRMKTDDAFNIGIAWAGHPDHSNDTMRSIALSRFEPLLKIKGAKWYSLQKEKYQKWTNIDAANVIDYDIGEQISDFADTAAIIANLDLVISVDTAVVHLAGALGKKVWCLLPFCPDWRWMIDRSDSPWYPSMRLFRQPAPGDWDCVISDVRHALTILMSEK